MRLYNTIRYYLLTQKNKEKERIPTAWLSHPRNIQFHTQSISITSLSPDVSHSLLPFLVLPNVSIYGYSKLFRSYLSLNVRQTTQRRLRLREHAARVYNAAGQTRNRRLNRIISLNRLTARHPKWLKSIEMHVDTFARPKVTTSSCRTYLLGVFFFVLSVCRRRRWHDIFFLAAPQTVAGCLFAHSSLGCYSRYAISIIHSLGRLVPHYSCRPYDKHSRLTRGLRRTPCHCCCYIVGCCCYLVGRHKYCMQCTAMGMAKWFYFFICKMTEMSLWCQPNDIQWINNLWQNRRYDRTIHSSLAVILRTFFFSLRNLRNDDVAEMLNARRIQRVQYDALWRQGIPKIYSCIFSVLYRSLKGANWVCVHCVFHASLTFRCRKTACYFYVEFCTVLLRH